MVARCSSARVGWERRPGRASIRRPRAFARAAYMLFGMLASGSNYASTPDYGILFTFAFQMTRAVIYSSLASAERPWTSFAWLTW